MNLSPHFTLEELTFSQTAVRKGIDNTPSQAVINNLTELCQHVLEPIRTKLGKPIRVTSGYRSDELNKTIGGAKNSQHTEGKAADITCPEMPVKDFYLWIKKEFVGYGQLILEFPQSSGSWVHISYDGKVGNRNQDLVAIKEGGRTKYISPEEYFT